MILAEEFVYPAEPDSMQYEVIRSKCLLNIPDLYEEERFKGKGFRRAMDSLAGWHTLSVMMSPVFNSRGEVLGLIEVCNKESEGVGYTAFSKDDEKLITLLCA